jgi:hypothetical protein
MFSLFAGVCFAVKSKSTRKRLLLTRKTLTKFRKTVYEGISCGVNKGFSISNFVVGLMGSILFSILSSLAPITFKYVFE